MRHSIRHQRRTLQLLYSLMVLLQIPLQIPSKLMHLFIGTGISIFGGKRSNYGTFKLTVDGNSVTEASASSSSSSTKQLLASASGLEDGPHTAVFAHVGGGAIDIDSAVLEARVGSGRYRNHGNPIMIGTLTFILA